MRVLKRRRLVRSIAYTLPGGINIQHLRPHMPLVYAQVLNPATGEQLATIANLKGPDTDAAISAAATAFSSWASRTGKERAETMRRCGTCLQCKLGHRQTGVPVLGIDSLALPHRLHRCSTFLHE